MLRIAKANSFADFITIRNIARKTWPVAYSEILSQEQLEYMLNAFYSDEGLKSDQEKGHQFLIAYNGKEAVGFASFENHFQNESVTKIHKLYVLPETQGKGIGRYLIENIQQEAKQNEVKKIILNVNRFNKALSFYQKLGFKIIREVDIQLEFGYLMEDYVLERLM